MRELVRRRVLRTAGLYLVAVWGVSQGAAEIFPLFGASEDDVRLFIIGSLGLLPFVAIVSWMYDVTGHGLRRDPEDVRERVRAEAANEKTVSVAIGDLPSERVRLEVRDGEQDDATVQTGEFIIGREEGCAVRYEDPAVSRAHARVFPRDGRWVIRDLGSTNGTFLDGRRIRESELPRDCRLRVNESGPTLHLVLVPLDDDTSLAGVDFGRTLVVRRR